MIKYVQAMSSAKIAISQTGCWQTGLTDSVLIGRQPINEGNACFLSGTVDIYSTKSERCQGELTCERR